MPNRQDLIKECRDYGFSTKEISEYLDIEEWFVKSALVKSPTPRTEIPAKSTSKTYYPQYAHSTEKTILFYEVLYEHGPQEINRLIKNMGPKSAAKFLRIKWNTLHTLKIHFGYEDPIPSNALELCLYFPEDVRREIDVRDGHKCARCDRIIDVKNRRYHKIYHPGPITAENGVTLCQYCRTTRINKFLKYNPKMFDGLSHREFVDWIKCNAPFIKRDRIYPKGQIGTWQ
jgi:hypothetical protein